MNFDKDLSQDLVNFIKEHREDNVQELLLSKKRNENWDWTFIANQIQGYQKAKVKFPELSQKGIIYPKKLSIEQSSSEKTAIIKSKLFNGKKMADLTGGFGVDSIYFSQSFESVDYVELNEELFNVLNYNLSLLGLSSKIQTFNQSAEEFLEKTSDSYDLIYLDPDRRKEGNKRVFLFEDCSPNILEMKDSLLERARDVLIKASPLIDLKNGIRELSSVKEIIIIGDRKEIKEVLFLLRKGNHEDIRVKCLTSDESAVFEFSMMHESQLSENLEGEKEFLYLPFPAITKAGAFKSIGNKFNLNKVNPNTHLYFSNTIEADFPGRIFKVKDDLKYKSKLKFDEKSTVFLRNFPESLPSLIKKHKIQEGNESNLFFYRGRNNELKVLVCDSI